MGAAPYYWQQNSWCLQGFFINLFVRFGFCFLMDYIALLAVPNCKKDITNDYLQLLQ